MIDVLLLAASGLAREVVASRLGPYRIIGMLDDDPAVHGTRVGGVEVLGPISLATEFDAALTVCAGPGRARRSIVQRLRALGIDGDRFTTLVDERTAIGDSCTIGRGGIVLAGVVVTSDVSIGSHAVLMPNCTVTHDDVLADFVTLAAGASLGGGVHLGEAAYVGMNASIKQRVTVGRDATVGMGSVVLGDVPDAETWVGVPARQMGVRA